jgi:hypothetical protein
MTTETPLQPPNGGDGSPNLPDNDTAHDLLLEFAGAAIGGTAVAALMFLIWCAKRHPGFWVKLFRCCTCGRWSPTHSQVARGASHIRRIAFRESPRPDSPHSAPSDLERGQSVRSLQMHLPNIPDRCTSPEYIVPDHSRGARIERQNAVDLSDLYECPDSDEEDAPSFHFAKPLPPPRKPPRSVGVNTLLRFETASPPLAGRQKQPDEASKA